MCMIDDSDGRVEVLSMRWPRARKPHKCGECHRVIEPGERYNIHAGTYEGEFVTHKTCEHCTVARDWLSAECGGWLYEGVEEDISEHATNGLYGRPVMRLAIGMRRKWRTRKGALMPVPEVPATTHEARAKQ
jgi:hypothetical protein